MGSDERDYQSHVMIEEEDDSLSPTNAYTTSRNRCCFNFPCFGSPPAIARLTAGGPTTSSSSSSPPSSFWSRFRAGEPHDETRWWARPVRALKKIREWSEIVAGPKWKTFIRRFNRNNNRNRAAGKFQYDPLSYALNFDEGPAGQNSQFEEDYDNFPDFSSRFAAIPLSARSSMDLGKGAPAG